MKPIGDPVLTADRITLAFVGSPPSMKLASNAGYFNGMAIRDGDSSPSDGVDRQPLLLPKQCRREGDRGFHCRPNVVSERQWAGHWHLE